MNKWVIKYAPRDEGDPNPWFLGCPNEMPELAYYEHVAWCNCRRFKTGNKAISFFRRRVRGQRLIRGEQK